jgi:large subunit ribosomal protein L35
MPKMKTHKGTAKRLKWNKKTEIKRFKAFSDHLKRKKSSKKKRELRQSTSDINTGDKKRIQKLLPYGS